MMTHATTKGSRLSALQTRYRLYRLCGWSTLAAWCAVIPVPMRRWTLRLGAIALGVWLS